MAKTRALLLVILPLCTAAMPATQAELPPCGGSADLRGTAISVFMAGPLTQIDIRFKLPQLPPISPNASLGSDAGLHIWYYPARWPKREIAHEGVNTFRTRPWISSLTLDCGNSVAISTPARPNLPTLLPFRERQNECVDAIQQSGRYTAIVSFGGVREPIRLNGRVSLNAAMIEADRIRSRELAKLRRGECYLLPIPPIPHN